MEELKPPHLLVDPEVRKANQINFNEHFTYHMQPRKMAGLPYIEFDPKLDYFIFRQVVEEFERTEKLDVVRRQISITEPVKEGREDKRDNNTMETE